MSDRPLPPLLKRLASGRGPVLGFLKEYTTWLQSLKAHQENQAFQKDMLRQLSGGISTEANVPAESVSTKKSSGGQQDE
jgi:GTP-sensing pleiotropic transcriptional regulator CodY